MGNQFGGMGKNKFGTEYTLINGRRFAGTALCTPTTCPGCGRDKPNDNRNYCEECDRKLRNASMNQEE